jgi:aspartate/methionine/tyrosine aminotransferase
VLPPIEYLDFAHRWYGDVRYDLATSGISTANPDLLGAVDPSDLGSRQRFVQALSRRYGVKEQEIAPAMGTSGGLFVVYATLLSSGDHVLVEAPNYEPIWRVAQALGATIDRFERRFADAYDIDPDAVLAAVGEKTRVVTITNPHNPTGAIVSDDTIRRLAARLAERGVSLLIDEAYLELSKPRSTARHLGANVFTCSSATKCWGVSWARAGWVFLPEAMQAAALRVERYVVGMAPPVSWAYGALAVDAAETLLARAVELQAGKRALVDAFLAEHASLLTWAPPPMTSVFGFVRDLRGRDLLRPIERAIAEHKVIVAPGTFFGESSAFRLGWTTKHADVEPGLDLLARALELCEARPSR